MARFVSTPAPSGVHPWVAETGRRVRFSIVGNWLPDWDSTVQFVQRVEALGFDAYWTNDHPTRSMDCWTYLTALAGVTERLRLISLVSCVYYRDPVLLARQAADVDRVSHGRLVLGVGIGDDVPEFEQLGISFPPAAQRFEVMEETIHVVRGLWTGEPFAYRGKHFRYDNITIRPVPVQVPSIPVLIGGGGERQTLGQVARYADMSNFGAHVWAGAAFEVADVRRKYAVLARHCAAEGRRFEAVLRSHYTPLLTLAATPEAVERKRANAQIPDPHVRTGPVFATPEEAITHYQALADAGVQYFLACVNGADRETVDLLAREVMPALTLGTPPPPVGAVA